MCGFNDFQEVGEGTAADTYWRARLVARGVTYAPWEGPARRARFASKKALGTPDPAQAAAKARSAVPGRVFFESPYRPASRPAM